MKYLQLYDHLGNLVKEFEVYVDGQDFNWAASKPEPIWLGTIWLANEKGILVVEPTPEPTVEEQVKKAVEQAETEEEKQDIKVMADDLAEVEEAEVQTQPPFTTQEPTTKAQPESEVKRESKKRSYKSRRSSGASSPASLKRAKAVSS